MTQGDPLAMALCGVALLPLIEHLRQGHPRVMPYRAMASGSPCVTCSMERTMKAARLARRTYRRR